MVMFFDAVKRKQVWIVDDDREVAESYSLFLQDSYETTLFTSAEEALNAFDHGTRPDVIIADLVMRDGMDGLGFAAAIRKISQDTPFILLSGLAERAHLISAIDNQVFSYLDKPCDPEVLLSKIVSAMKWRNQIVMSQQLIMDLKSQTQNYSAITRYFADRYTWAESRLGEEGVPLAKNPDEIQAFLKKNIDEAGLLRQIDEKQAKIDKMIYKLVIQK